MPDILLVEVATPERLVLREQAHEVQIPAKDGYLGILPGHAALLSELGTGQMSYSSDGRRGYLAVSGGFLEVVSDQVRVLADCAERAEEIDVARAQAALKRAQEHLAASATEPETKQALNAMKRAQARLEAAGQK